MLLVASVAGHFLAFHLPLVRLLRERGWEVHAACDPAGDGETLEGHGVKVWPVPFRRSPWDPRNLAAFPILLGVMRRETYRMVHAHTPVAAFMGRLAAGLARVPATVYTAHGFHFYRGAPLRNWLLYYPAEWLAAFWTDALVTINGEDFRRALRLPVRGKVYHVPGVGVSSPAEAPRLGGMTVLAAGELSTNKNLGQVLRAWRLVLQAVPDAILLVAGEGPQSAGLRRLAARLGIARSVSFLGHRRDLPQLLAQARVVVSASRREGLPRVILEAMAAARPVVATDIRGHRDLIEHGRTGFLVPPRDPAAMAGAMIQLLTEPTLAAAMGERASQLASGYAVERVVAVMDDIYREWLGGTP